MVLGDGTILSSLKQIIDCNFSNFSGCKYAPLFTTTASALLPYAAYQPAAFLQPFSNPWWLWWRCWKLAIRHFYFLPASRWTCQESIIVIIAGWLGLSPFLEVTSYQKQFLPVWKYWILCLKCIFPAVHFPDINIIYFKIPYKQTVYKWIK